MKTIQFNPVTRTLNLTGTLVAYMAVYTYKTALDSVFGTDLDMQIDAEEASIERNNLVNQLNNLRRLARKPKTVEFERTALCLNESTRHNRKILADYKKQNEKLILEILKEEALSVRLRNEGILDKIWRNTIEAAYNKVVSGVKYVANKIISIPKAVARGIFDLVAKAATFSFYTVPAYFLTGAKNLLVSGVMGCAKAIDQVFNSVVTGCINIVIYPFNAVATGVYNFVKSALFGKSVNNDVQAVDPELITIPVSKPTTETPITFETTPAVVPGFDNYRAAQDEDDIEEPGAFTRFIASSMSGPGF